MADPITWRILQTLGGQLAVIDPANGYHTDAGSRIQYEHREFGEHDTYPQIVLAIEAAPIGDSTSRAYSSTLTVVAEAYVRATLDNAQYLAHAVMEDITWAWIEMKRESLTDVSRFQLLGERQILQRPEGLEFVVVQVRAEAVYHDRKTP